MNTTRILKLLEKNSHRHTSSFINTLKKKLLAYDYAYACAKKEGRFGDMRDLVLFMNELEKMYKKDFGL